MRNMNLSDASLIFEGLTCKSCLNPFSQQFLQNFLDLMIRKFTQQYHTGTYTCTKCSYHTGQTFIQNDRFKCIKTDCIASIYKEYESVDLYLQIAYFKDLFDFSRIVLDRNCSREEFMNLLKTEYGREYDIFNHLHKHLKLVLLKNQYFSIDLQSVFSFCDHK